jgi:hypothetical protein
MRSVRGPDSTLVWNRAVVAMPRLYVQARYEVTAVDGTLGKQHLAGQAPPDRGALSWRNGVGDWQSGGGCRPEQLIGDSSYAVGVTAWQLRGEGIKCEPNCESQRLGFAGHLLKACCDGH